MNLQELEEVLEASRAKVEDFLAYHRNQVLCPVYASVDVRMNAHKAAVVDANAFPAGFNNLNEASRTEATQAMQRYIGRTVPGAKNVLLIPEDHTRNLGYLENVKTLVDLLHGAGFDATIGTLNREVFPKAEFDTISGAKIVQHAVMREGDDLVAAEVVPDVVLLNRDLAEGTPKELDGIRQPVMPPPSMGWHRRRKADHFRLTKNLLGQLGAHVGFDPWLLFADSVAVDGVDFRTMEGIDRVAAEVDAMMLRMQVKIVEHGGRSDATVFVKADPGTYGMGVVAVRSGSELKAINSRMRSRMDTGKSGLKTRRVLVQEGVWTDERVPIAGGSAVAEPVLYLVCGHVVGGFHRIHDKKMDDESLSSPGATFQSFSMAEAQERRPRGGILRLLGEVASIATGYELRFADRPTSTPPNYP